jgi:hypothetical protein
VMEMTIDWDVWFSHKMNYGLQGLQEWRATSLSRNPRRGPQSNEGCVTGALFCHNGVPELSSLATPFVSKERKTGDELDVKRSVFMNRMISSG